MCSICSARAGLGADLLGSSQAVLLPLNKAVCIFSFARGTQPLALWNLLQGGRQTKQMAALVTAIAQNDLLLVMTAFAQLAVEREDVVWHTNLVCCLTAGFGVLHAS